MQGISAKTVGVLAIVLVSNVMLPAAIAEQSLLEETLSEETIKRIFQEILRREHSSNSVGFELYDLCVVKSNIDPFTDSTTIHSLSCFSLSGRSALLVMCQASERPRVVIKLKPESTKLYFEERIRIRYRFDKHDHVETSWFWDNETGSAGEALSYREVSGFLRSMAIADHLIFQTGDERGAIGFGEKTNDAVKDFTSRCPVLQRYLNGRS